MTEPTVTCSSPSGPVSVTVISGASPSVAVTVVSERTSMSGSATTASVLAPIYPLDRTANADGRRKIVDPDHGSHDAEGTATDSKDGDGPDKPLPPLLKRILDEYSAGGKPPAYLPKKPHPKKGKES